MSGPMNKASAQRLRASRLRAWYSNPLGRELAIREQQALDDHLPNLFGYHLLVVDPPWEDGALSSSRIAHRIVLCTEPDQGVPAGVFGMAGKWPIMSDTLDAVLLPHTLELAADPHQILREADRSLIPEGHLVIFGFNPISPWGVRRLLALKRGRMPWSARFFAVNRIKDWLSLLGFDTLHTRFIFHRLPLHNQQVLNRTGFMESIAGEGWPLLAADYMLVARKRVSTLTPVKPRWQPRRLFTAGVAGSSQGRTRHVG
jgi:SAM-dependent methyltransferase